MADIIDIRDLIERFETLETARELLQEKLDAIVEDSQTGPDLNEAHVALDQWDNEYGTEFQELTDLLDELRGQGGDEQWRGAWYPVTLVPEDEFEDYMDEFLEDCGDIPKFENIPEYINITVDYDMLRSDYTEVEFEGTTYLFR